MIGIFAGFIASFLLEEHEYERAALAALFVLLATLIEFVLADAVTEQLYPIRTQAILDRLERNLRAYHDHVRASIGRVIQELRGSDKTKVSGTFHLVVDLYLASEEGVEEALVQLTDYSGSLGGQRWRFNSATKGLIGRCLRTGQSEWVNFSSEEEYTERMIREFGYTKQEMFRHTREARSYWAEPVFVHNKMIGVIFLFSTEIQVFPNAIQVDHVRAQAREISAYLEGARLI